MRKGFLRWAATVVVAVSITPGPALAQSGLVWSYARYPGADGAPEKLFLSYGIPETDATLFLAECFNSPDIVHVEISLGMDIGDLAGDAAVEVQFTGVGFDRTLPGTILRPEDEGIQGARFTVGLYDPIWDAIAGLATLGYGIAGLGQRDLPLTGSAGPTRRFISECGALPPAPLP